MLAVQGYLYWVDTDLVRVPVTGGATETVWPIENGVAWLQTDGQSLYGLNDTGDANEIVRISADGITATTLVVPSAPVDSMHVASDYVYWAEGASEADGLSLYRIPKSGGNPERALGPLPWVDIVTVSDDTLYYARHTTRDVGGLNPRVDWFLYTLAVPAP